MMTEQGRVVAVEQDAVWVEVIQTSACQSCKAKAGCGQKLLQSVADGRRHHVRVACDAQQLKAVAVDSQVEIGIPEQAMLKGVLWVYLIPLVAMFAGALLARDWWGEGDLIAIAGALLGMAMGMSGVRWASAQPKLQQDMQPVLLKTLPTTIATSAASSLG